VRRRLTWTTLAAAILGLAFSSAAAEAVPVKSATTNLMVPFDQTVSVTGDAGSTDIALAGDIHVVSHVVPGEQANIYINLAGMTGTGTDGVMYLGLGAFQLTDVLAAEQPPAIKPFTVPFSLVPVGVPADPGAFLTLNINFALKFGPTGVLQSVGYFVVTE